MSLPKIDVPTYEVVVPSTQKTITIRPFLVKEEKILLTALQSEEAEDVANATKQIVRNCIVTPGVDVDKLEIFDFEYLILQLRIHSIGETTTIRFLPIENTKCAECSKHREVVVNLKDAKVENLKETNANIKITDTVGLSMRYPTTKLFALLEAAKTSKDLDLVFKLIWSCIDYVYDADTITSARDVTEKEGIEFLESLSSDTFKEIEKFLSDIPKVQQTIHVKCSKCTFEQDYVLTGLQDFFA
jgi:hypothetical protein